VTSLASTTKQATEEKGMKKLKKCTLPKNHRDYYYIMVDTDKRTGKKKERQIYPNLFIDLVSIPMKKERKI
jgi:hypothetical protein